MGGRPSDFDTFAASDAGAPVESLPPRYESTGTVIIAPACEEANPNGNSSSSTAAAPADSPKPFPPLQGSPTSESRDSASTPQERLAASSAEVAAWRAVLDTAMSEAGAPDASAQPAAAATSQPKPAVSVSEPAAVSDAPSRKTPANQSESQPQPAASNGASPQEEELR